MRTQPAAILLAVVLMMGAIPIPAAPTVSHSHNWTNSTVTNGTATITDAGTVTSGVFDDFDTFDTSPWSLDATASYRSGPNAVSVTNPDGGRHGGELTYDRGIGDQDWYARFQAKFTSADGAAQIWFSANHNRPESMPTSSEGWRITWSRATQTVSVSHRTGGRWIKIAERSATIDSGSFAAAFDASRDALTVYSVDTGKHVKIITTPVNADYTNTEFYLAGSLGNTTTGGAVWIDNVRIKTWGSQVESPIFAAPELETGYRYSVAIRPGDTWNDWQIAPSNPVLFKNNSISADPILFVEPNRTYPYRLLARDSDRRSMDLWRSKNLTGWELVDENAVPALGNTGRIGPNGRYYVYYTIPGGGTGLLIGDSLTTWTDKGRVINKPDPGVFYSAETDTWHLFYEQDSAPGGPSSYMIGHATSPNGIDNWTVHDPVVNMRGTRYHTGDPDILKVGDQYHLFIDKSPNHPRYGVVHYTSEDLYGNFTRGDTFALTANESTWFDYGVADPTVRYDGETFYMYFEAWNESKVSGGSTRTWQIGYATSDGPAEPASARLHIDEDDDGTPDTTTSWQSLNEGYRLGERMASVERQFARLPVTKPMTSYSVEARLSESDRSVRADSSLGEILWIREPKDAIYVGTSTKLGPGRATNVTAFNDPIPRNPQNISSNVNITTNTNVVLNVSTFDPDGDTVTEFSLTAASGIVTVSISGLDANSSYVVEQDAEPWKNVTTDGTGMLTVTKNSNWSKHTFRVAKVGTTGSNASDGVPLFRDGCSGIYIPVLRVCLDLPDIGRWLTVSITEPFPPR